MSNPSPRNGAPPRGPLGHLPRRFVPRPPPGTGAGQPFDGSPHPDDPPGDDPAPAPRASFGAPPEGVRGRAPGGVRGTRAEGGADVRASDITARIRHALRKAQLKLLASQLKLRTGAAALHARLGSRE